MQFHKGLSFIMIIMKLLFLGYFMMAFGEDVADEGATAQFESPIFTAEASQCFNFFFSLHVSFKLILHDISYNLNTIYELFNHRLVSGQNGICIQNYLFGPKKDSEKLSRISFFFNPSML